MKHYMNAIIALSTVALFAVTSVQAKTEEKMMIALKTDNFELTETDISALAIGESQTIETDDGKIIDILRTADGVDLYIDGKLLKTDFDGEGLHEEHMLKKHVEVICNGDEECDKNVFVLAGDDDELHTWMSDQGDQILLHEDSEFSCSADDGESSCSGKVMIISDGEDVDLEELHEMHKSGSGHKVIMIRKEIIAED